MAASFTALLFLVLCVYTQETPAPGNMVWIPPGSFMMGSPEGTGEQDEHPQHAVTLDGFWMDKFEVTQKDYALLMKRDPSGFPFQEGRPVESVSWKEARVYCAKEGKRLPTEAEWEYACRAGSVSAYFWGDSLDPEYVWYRGNSAKRTMPGGGKKPNAWGLYDMSGSVWEWCEDAYSSDYYAKSLGRNPKGPNHKREHVIRGGSWVYDARFQRSAIRNTAAPDMTVNDLGFRCVRAK